MVFAGRKGGKTTGPLKTPRNMGKGPDIDKTPLD